MALLDDLKAVLVAEVGKELSIPDLWKQYLTSLGYTQSTVLGQMQAYAEDNGMSITAVVNYVASGAVGGGDPDTVPDAPTIGTATAGDTEATITFTPPVDDGGAEITLYTMTSSPGGLTGTGTESPITVTGLTNGVEYTFTVTATNSVGTSDPSAASNAVTPTAANLLSNGTLDTDTVWSKQTGWTISGGKANKAPGSAGNLSQPFAFVSGGTYEVTYTVDSISGGNVNPRFITGATTVAGDTQTTPGTYVEELVASTHTVFAINAQSTTTCVIDNISMIRIS